MRTHKQTNKQTNRCGKRKAILVPAVRALRLVKNAEKRVGTGLALTLSSSDMVCCSRAIVSVSSSPGLNTAVDVEAVETLGVALRGKSPELRILASETFEGEDGRRGDSLNKIA